MKKAVLAFSLAVFSGSMTLSALAANPTDSWGVSLAGPFPKVNTWDRAAVIQHFRDNYVANHWLPIKDPGADWTNGTTPGVRDVAISKAMLNKINCLRKLTGATPYSDIPDDYQHTETFFKDINDPNSDYYVTYTDAECARWAAFVNAPYYAAHDDITHTLPKTALWYNDEAREGNASSLIAIDTGYPSTNSEWPDLIQAFCWEGLENVDNGHLEVLVANAYSDSAYVAVCPFTCNSTAKTASAVSATPSRNNRLSVVCMVNRPADFHAPFDNTKPYQFAYPSEGYFPKGFLPTYWLFEPDGSTYTWKSINNGNEPDVTIKKNGVVLDGVRAWFAGGMINMSLPTLTNATGKDYDTAVDGLRGSVLKDDLKESGDVIYEVTIKVRVSSDPAGAGKTDYSDETYQYTVVAFDWPDNGRLTYQVFPDEYQVGYNWKYTSWLGYYYTAGGNWIYSEKLDDWLYVCDGGNFGHSGTIYTGKTLNGNLVWDVPTAAQANYSFWAWSTKKGSWLWINPLWMPWAWDDAQGKWVKLP
jgi:hypothetical protein